MKCLNPQTIYNRYVGKYVTVPCGKCECCQISKQNSLAQRCANECKRHLRNIFFTLTYTNNYVPVVRPHSNIILLRRRNIQVFRKRIALKDYKDGLITDRSLVGEVVKDYKFKDAYDFIPPDKYNDFKVDNLFSKVGNNDLDGVAHSDYTGVLSYRDINLFFKRLRYAISKTTYKGEKFSHCIIGEYGGERNRPHYHGIIHTDNVKFADWLIQNLLPIWRMADIDAMSRVNRYGSNGLPQFVDEGKVCSYVTKYVSMFNCDSKRYGNFPVKPFFITSKFPYYGLSPHDKALVESVIYNDDPSFERLVKSGDNFISVASPLSLENRLWYRFDGIDKTDDTQLCYIALRYFTVPDTPKGRFSRFVVNRCREIYKSVESLGFSQLYEYITRVRRFVNRLKSFHLRRLMDVPINIDYYLSRLSTWSDCLHILVDKKLSIRSKLSLFCESLYNKMLDIGLVPSDSLFTELAQALFNLPVYQRSIAHDYRAKYRKNLLGKHMSNLSF